MYLDDIEQGIKQYESQYKTGNAVLDTILTSKALGCAKDDIELTCVADGTLLGCVSEMDMCTLVGNALDNAIEYERLLDDGERRLIHVTVSRVNGFVLIRVENYINNPGAFVIRNGLPVTTKGNTDYHGFQVEEHPLYGHVIRWNAHCDDTRSLVRPSRAYPAKVTERDATQNHIERNLRSILFR
ncbi:MAG: GHKL domain-containing protein [Bifidobacterium dentium]